MSTATHHAKRAQDPDSISTFAWNGALSPLHAVPQLALLYLAIFASQDVLRSQALQQFVRAVSSILPWIGVHAESTKYPELALAIACSVIVGLGWSACIWFLQSMYNYRILLVRQRAHRTVSLASTSFLILGGAIILACVFFMFGIPGDPSWSMGFTTDSVTGLVLLSSPFIYGGGMVLGGVPVTLRLLCDLSDRSL